MTTTRHADIENALRDILYLASPEMMERESFKKAAAILDGPAPPAGTWTEGLRSWGYLIAREAHADGWMVGQGKSSGEGLIALLERLGAPPDDVVLPARVDLRPEVIAFACLMEERLSANDHKGGWKNDDPSDLLARVREETVELDKAVASIAWMDRDNPTRPESRALVGREAADVANFAMMVADASKALPNVEQTDQVPATVVLLLKGDRVEIFDDRGYGVRPNGERVGDGSLWVPGTVEFVCGPKRGGHLGHVSVYCDDGRGRRVVQPDHVRRIQDRPPVTTTQVWLRQLAGAIWGLAAPSRELDSDALLALLDLAGSPPDDAGSKVLLANIERGGEPDESLREWAWRFWACIPQPLDRDDCADGVMDDALEECGPPPSGAYDEVVSAMRDRWDADMHAVLSASEGLADLSPNAPPWAGPLFLRVTEMLDKAAASRVVLRTCPTCRAHVKPIGGGEADGS